MTAAADPAPCARRQGFNEGYSAAIAHLRWLAEARDHYDYPEVKRDTDMARALADYLEKEPDRAWGWLPSVYWDEWAERRMNDLAGV